MLLLLFKYCSCSFSLFVDRLIAVAFNDSLNRIFRFPCFVRIPGSADKQQIGMLKKTQGIRQYFKGFLFPVRCAKMLMA